MIIYLFGHQDNTRMRRYVAELRQICRKFAGSQGRVLQICRRIHRPEPFRRARIVACAAARRAIGTRNGEHET